MTEALTDKAFGAGGRTPRDAQLLQETLVQGDLALARRKDLGDLYKRIVAMVATPDAGLTARQEARANEDQAALSERLMRLERAIDGVEGVLRIEMDRVIRTALAEAPPPPPPRRPRGVALAVLLFVLGAAGGAVFSDQIRALAAETFRQPSPDGGIAPGGNRQN